MKAYLPLLALCVSACDEVKIKHTVRNDIGVAAEITEVERGVLASNTARIDLISANGSTKVNIFKGSDGSYPDVAFQGKHLVIVQYCWASEMRTTNSLYSLGDDPRFREITIVFVTIETRIGGRTFCKGVHVD